MNGAQVAMLLIMGFDLGSECIKHGEPKTGIAATYNVWVRLLSVLILVGLLWWGGFWA